MFLQYNLPGLNKRCLFAWKKLLADKQKAELRLFDIVIQAEPDEF